MDSDHIPKVVTRVEEERRGQELEEEEELGEEEEGGVHRLEQRGNRKV